MKPFKPLFWAVGQPGQAGLNLPPQRSGRRQVGVHLLPVGPVNEGQAGHQGPSGNRRAGAIRRALRRPAMTLLEVILALALSLLVLWGLSMAIDSHLRVVDRSRRHVEQALLARSLLHRIADDIRSAIRYDPQNIRALVPQLTTQSLEDLAAQAGLGQMDFSDIEDPEATAAETTPPPPVPGIYGNRYELYIDLSRLPRLDQFQYELVATEGSPILDRTSEVKRVAYYVVRPEITALAEAAAALTQSGLVRWELDRAVSLLAAEEGTLADIERQVQPLAPEVLGIEFEYFDGQQWLPEWDSQAMGGLPVAIRIALALASEGSASSRSGLWGMFSGDSASPAEPVIYRMLVHLPASAPMQDTSTLESLLETMESEQSEGPGQPQEAKQAASASQLGDGSSTGPNQTDQQGTGGGARRGGGAGGFGREGFGPGGGRSGSGPGGRPGQGPGDRSGGTPGGFGPGGGSGGFGPGGAPAGPGSAPGGGPGRFGTGPQGPGSQRPGVGPGGGGSGQGPGTPPSSGSGTGRRSTFFGGGSTGGSFRGGSSGSSGGAPVSGVGAFQSGGSGGGWGGSSGSRAGSGAFSGGGGNR